VVETVVIDAGQRDTPPVEVRLASGASVDLAETRVQSERLAMLITSPVTKARPADRDDVIKICKEDAEENAQFSLSVPKLEAMVSRILDRGEGVIGIIRGLDEIEAIMLMQISQMWFTDEWSLEEVLNFVRPRYRRSTHAKSMIQFAKRCSDEIGIPLMIGVVSNERTAAKMLLYERQLGKPVGGYFLYSKRPLVAPLVAKAAIA
jgi:hypothetical protein